MTIFQNISADPQILGGKPCLKGTRISVEMVLEWFASGATFEDILQRYPHIRLESLQEALRYALFFMKNEIVIEIAA